MTITKTLEVIRSITDMPNKNHNAMRDQNHKNIATVETNANKTKIIRKPNAITKKRKQLGLSPKKLLFNVPYLTYLVTLKVDHRIDFPYHFLKHEKGNKVLVFQSNKFLLH